MVIYGLPLATGFVWVPRATWEHIPGSSSLLPSPMKQAQWRALLPVPDGETKAQRAEAAGPGSSILAGQECQPCPQPTALCPTARLPEGGFLGLGFSHLSPCLVRPCQTSQALVSKNADVSTSWPHPAGPWRGRPEFVSAHRSQASTGQASACPPGAFMEQLCGCSQE